MAKVIGFGGFFFKARDPKALAAWYAKHLGLKVEDFGGVMFNEDESRPGCMLWSPFSSNTRYFDPSDKPYMVNFRVDNLDELLQQLRSAGVQVDAKVDVSEYGRFGWVIDPEGTRIELWQPPDNPAV